MSGFGHSGDRATVDNYPRINILGVGVHAINMAGALDAIINGISSGRRGYVCVTSAHGIMEAQEDPVFRTILNRSFLTVPDGMPLVWIGRFTGHSQIGRVYGPDLMRRLCDRGREHGLRHFLYGGMEGVAQTLKRQLEIDYPGILIAGTFTPPFRPLNPSEEAQLIAEVERTQPHIIWVGLSTPKQERFMAGYLDRLQTQMMFGVGAAFDIISKRVPEAPRWVQRAGLEWFFRLCVEPRRLWKRYAKVVPRFPILVSLQLLGLKKFTLD